MQPTPREKDKLMVAMATEAARKRLARGVKLNHPEAVALITDFVVEGARDGRSVADLMTTGAAVITRDQCMEGIADTIQDVQVGSHYRFAETNSALSFDRDAARGMRLDIAAGTAVRFEPSQTRNVTLVPYRGARRAIDFNGAVMGDL